AAVRAQFGSAATLVLLHDPGAGATTVLAAEGWQQVAADQALNLDGRPAGDVLRDGVPRYFETGEALDAAYPHLAVQRRADGVHAAASVPLLAGGEAVGVLQLHWR